MSVPTVARRLGRVAAAREAAGMGAACRRLAAILRLDPGELRAEAERVAARCRDAGAASTDACVGLVAGDLGMPVWELRAEIALLRGAADAAP